MRIAMVSTPFVDVPPPGYGGTELIVHALSEGLAARGHEVVLYATGRSRIPGEVRYRFEAPRWPPNRQDDLEHLAFAFEDIAKDPLGFDAVHVHSPMALPFARALGIKVAYTLHHEQKPELSALYQRFPEAAFIAISARQRALETPLPDISVIHHGLNSDRYPVGPGGDEFFFLGRLSPYKGCHTAIDAVVEAGGRIVVAGGSHAGVDEDGGVEARYFAEELSWRLRLPAVRYVGEVGPDTKRPLLRRAAALLCPIEWEEPFGLVVIEAMLSGTPVIGFPRGALPELIEPGLTGFLAASPGELKDRLYETVALDRRRIRRRAIERFGHLRMVDEHLALYRRLAQGRPDVLAGTAQEAASL
jgi:glycosyltransferase involved in cell wall biosynthesis